MNLQPFDKILDLVRENEHEKLDNYLDSNKNIDLNQKENGSCAIHLCVGYPECVKVLLVHGAKPDIADKNHKQPIHLAVERDFIETIMLLVIYGTDFNTLSNGKTPLQIAAEENASICQDFLHFLGAKVPDDQHSVFDNETRNKYGIMQKGFNDSDIICGWSEIPAKCDRPVEIKSPDKTPVGIAIQGYGDVCSVFVRKMHVEFQTSSIRIPVVPVLDSMELVSDIYQYRVDKTVSCDLHIPLRGVNSSDRYKELLVVQMMSFGPNSEQVLRNVNLADGKAVIKGTQLNAQGSSPTVAFGIFSSNRADKAIVDSSNDLTLQSTVETLFKVVVPAGCAPNNTEIEIQVIKARSDRQSPDSGIGSHSDFLSVSSRGTPTSDEQSDIFSQRSLTDLTRPLSADSSASNSSDDVYIRLPKPPLDPDSEVAVMKCRQGNDGSEPDSWEKHEVVKENIRSIQCKKAGFANYIVLGIKEFGYLIKEFVSRLFSRSKGEKQTCILFAMVKPRVNTTEFLVKIVLCHVDDYDKRLNDCLAKSFKEQESGPSDIIEINTKCIYMLKLNLTDATVINGPEAMPIQYQGDIPKSQTFTVNKIQHTASGNVMTFKKEVPENPKKYWTKVKVVMPIQFEACKTETVPNDRFLSDRFIKEEAQRTIGIKWLPLGIHLGFTCAELFGFQDLLPDTRNCMILYKWRDKPNETLEEKLDTFVIATREEHIPDLKNTFLHHALEFRQKKKDLDVWIRKYERPGRNRNEIKFKFSLLTTKPVSPLGDKFLLLIANKLECDDRIFIDLDLSFAELQDRISDQKQRGCKLLMLARDKFSERTKFLDKLVGTLKKHALNLTVEELSIFALKWLDSEEGRQSDMAPSLLRIFGLS